MNRNSSSHFSATDNRINIGRSKFNRDSWYKTTMNFGDLVPFYVDEILPGDTFDMKTSVLCRMSTPKVPVADNSYLDTYYFFIPTRLLWDSWAAFNGESDPNNWDEIVEHQVPFMTLGDAGEFSVADYFGLPLPNLAPDGQDTLVQSVSALPFRAYQLIWNEWFRDQNLQYPVLISKSDDVTFDERQALLTLRKVNKFHDYFTSALPAPQKGPAVLIPGLEDIPVLPSTSLRNTGANAPMTLAKAADGLTVSNCDVYTYSGNLMVNNTGSVPSGTGAFVYPNNLFANAGVDTGATIDALRTAFQIQKLLWRDGNGGTRYTEILRSHFGVVSPDGRLQRPEYLGGKRIPLSMNQVIQQAPNTSQSGTALGDTGAYSKTVDTFDGFTKSFTEHGYIIGVCCARTDHTYQQGINKLWKRRNRFDFYYPELANIGEQPVYQHEIYAYNNGSDDVFGYQEAWAEYRYRPSYVTGAFRSGLASGSLDFWHYADDYSTAPILSGDWIEEPIANVNRTLIIPGSTASHDQLLLDFYFDLKCTRPMPVYSVPGLVDHF